jgi:hypothetical protein
MKNPVQQVRCFVRFAVGIRKDQIHEQKSKGLADDIWVPCLVQCEEAGHLPISESSVSPFVEAF